METVKLWTGKVGPIEITYRPTFKTEFGSQFGEVKRFISSLENGCRLEMPQEVWESLRDEFVDRRQGLTYKEAFVEL